MASISVAEVILELSRAVCAAGSPEVSALMMSELLASIWVRAMAGSTVLLISACRIRPESRSVYIAADELAVLSSEGQNACHAATETAAIPRKLAAHRAIQAITAREPYRC